MYQKNSLGAKSINTAQSFYQTFAEPIVPYLQTPYSIVSPYLAKADSLGDSSLSTVDSHFPALKSTNMEKLRGTAYDAANFPFKLAGDSKTYVFRTYDDEYKKIGGEGLPTTAKAFVSTQLRIVSDVFHAVGDYLEPKKEQLQAEYEKAKSTGADRIQKTKKAASDKKDELVNKQQQMVNSH